MWFWRHPLTTVRDPLPMHMRTHVYVHFKLQRWANKSEPANKLANKFVPCCAFCNDATLTSSRIPNWVSLQLFIRKCIAEVTMLLKQERQGALRQLALSCASCVRLTLWAALGYMCYSMVTQVSELGWVKKRSGSGENGDNDIQYMKTKTIVLLHLFMTQICSREIYFCFPGLYFTVFLFGKVMWAKVMRGDIK